MFLIRVVIVRQYLRSAVCAVVPPSGREHATWVEYVCVSDSLVYLHCAHLFPLLSWLDAAAVEIKDKALDANGRDIMALYDCLQMRLGNPKLATLCPRVHLYVGGEVLKNLLKDVQKLEGLYEMIASLIAKSCKLSILLKTLASLKLDGMKRPDGYWVVNAGRLLVKDISGIHIPGEIFAVDLGLQMVLRMGEAVILGEPDLPRAE